MRIDPPTSAASPNGAPPAPTIAPSPPELPPAVRVASNALLVDAVAALHPHAQLGEVRDADRDRARRAKPRDRRRVAARRVADAREEPARVGHPGEGERLFDRARDAVERPEIAVLSHVVVGAFGFVASRREPVGDEGVEPRVDLDGTRDVRLDHGGRRHLAITDEACEGGRRLGEERIHAAPSLLPAPERRHAPLKRGSGPADNRQHSRGAESPHPP